MPSILAYTQPQNWGLMFLMGAVKCPIILLRDMCKIYIDLLHVIRFDIFGKIVEIYLHVRVIISDKAIKVQGI